MGSKEENVTQSDQKLINRFARLNAKSEELLGEIKEKKVLIENIAETLTELSLFELNCDDSEHVFVQSGEIFANLSIVCAQNMCELKGKELEENVLKIESSLKAMKEEMNGIKVELYAKFGSNINLEYDSD